MARIRTIKPEFWEDEKIARLPMSCRLFFIGTWNIADDAGVFRSNVALLKSKIFPYDDIRTSEIQKHLDALVEAQMIVPISHNGESYYVIRTFRSHQKFDPRYPNYLIDNEILNSLMGAQSSHTVDPSGAQREPATGGGKGMGKGIIPPPPNGGVPPLADGGVLVDPDCQTPPDEQAIKPSAEEEKKKKLREKEKENFLRFQQWIADHAPQVAKLKEPFTQAEFERIKQEFTIEQIQSIITKMHNWKPLLTKRVSANLTFRDWSKKEYNQHHGTTTNGGEITTIDPTQSKSERDMEFAQHIARKLTGSPR